MSPEKLGRMMEEWKPGKEKGRWHRVDSVVYGTTEHTDAWVCQDPRISIIRLKPSRWHAPEIRFFVGRQGQGSITYHETLDEALYCADLFVMPEWWPEWAPTL